MSVWQCLPEASNRACAVCLEHLHTSRQEIQIPPCQHLLHNDCYNELLRKSYYKCPVCGKSMIDMTAVSVQSMIDMTAVSVQSMIDMTAVSVQSMIDGTAVSVQSIRNVAKICFYKYHLCYRSLRLWAVSTVSFIDFFRVVTLTV